MAIYGIKAVKYCLSKNLLHYVEADAGGGQTQDIEVFNPATGQCTVTNPLTVLPCLVGSKATLTVDDAVVNRRHQYTARLTFVTADNPNLDGEYYAFVVETNEGEQMLLGSKVAPRCSVTTRQNVAATAGDINGYTTTVDFKAPYAPLRVTVTERPAPTILTVIWQNYNGVEVDRKTYQEGEPEPTTEVVPTRPDDSQYSYAFDEWELLSETELTTTYIATYTPVPLVTEYAVKAVLSTPKTDPYFSYGIWYGQYMNFALLGADMDTAKTHAYISTYHTSEIENCAIMFLCDGAPTGDSLAVPSQQFYNMLANIADTDFSHIDAQGKTAIMLPNSQIQVGLYDSAVVTLPFTIYRQQFYRNYTADDSTLLLTAWTNEVVPSSPTPTREGYTFQGWALSRDGAVVWPASSSTYRINSANAFYAIWAPNS